MKTKLLLTLLLSFIFGLVSSQVPQGFNYQAVARLTTGEPIINTTMPVRITIQADSLGTSVIWQELHSTVTTNGFGLINLVLGKGTRQAASTVATFSAIDWSIIPKFIKTEINYGGWKTMGVTRLWSVPYSTIAGSFGGPVKKLAVKGETALPDDALFEVKNKDGQTVFAVYNEGVRVYVSDGAKALKGGFAVGGFGTDKAESTKYMFVGKDSVRIYLDTNPLTKKLKGGFAVGGYDLTKGIVQDYLDVNADSVRIYIDSDPSTKKLKGGFAVGGYDMTKGTNTNYMNVNTDASGIINPSQNRILWYPLKNAFLTGKVLIENKDSVGENSFASGYESKAIGDWSQALGYKAIARGDYSTAIGKNAVADSINSFAFGENAKTKGDESYAIGRGAIADGFRSFAFGSAGVDSAGQITGVAYSKGDYSFAIGQGSQSLGKGSFTLGLADTAIGDFAVAIGYNTAAGGTNSTSMGVTTTASGNYSTAMGNQTTANGSNSTATGYKTTASGSYSTAIGYVTTASGLFSIALGNHTIANVYNSTAMGGYTTASGGYSTAMGAATTASGGYSVAMGYVTKASGNYSTATGYYSAASGLGSTAMGYYATASGGGLGSTAMGYYTVASSDGATAMGTYATASGVRSTAMGAWTTASGSYSTAMGYSTTANGYISTVMGYGTYTHSDYETVIGRYNSSYTPASPPGAGWNPVDRLFVIGNGINDVARSNALTVLKNGCVGLQSVTSPTYALELPNSATIAIGSGRAYAWTTYSDSRLKEKQTPLEYGLKEIMKLFPKQYIHHSSTDQSTWSAENAPKSIGLVAQDVFSVIPEAVNVPENNASELWGLDYDKFIPVLVKAIQEQQDIIESTQRENQQLKSQLQSLQEEVDQIKAMIVKGGGN